MSVRKKKKSVQPYDFKKSIAKNNLRALNFVHDRFARNLSSSVSAYLRTVVEVQLLETGQASYEDFVAGASNPTCYVAFSLQPLDGNAALEIRPDVVFAMIDRLLGGEGRSLEAVRPMTEIERRIVENLLKLIADELGECWKTVYTVNFKVTAIETHPHVVQVMNPSDKIIQIRFQVRTQGVTSTMSLAIPAEALKPVFQGLNREMGSRKRPLRDPTLIAQLHLTPAGVQIETAETLFSMETIVSLRPGDTLVLDQRDDWPVPLKVAGQAKLFVQPMKDTRRKAFAVVSTGRTGFEEQSHESITVG